MLRPTPILLLLLPAAFFFASPSASSKSTYSPSSMSLHHAVPPLPSGTVRPVPMRQVVPSGRLPWNLCGCGSSSSTTSTNTDYSTESTTTDTTTAAATESTKEDDDEERYSRHFYTLGARAHTLVRSSTVLIDGPAASGLVYEAAKNLALSGVSSILILTNDGGDGGGDEGEEGYFEEGMDDLGKF